MTDRARSFILDGPIGRVLLTLSVPIVLGNLLQAGYQLTDAFWVGRLGAPAVAAVAVSLPVTSLVIALGSGLPMAGAVLVAQYVGAGRHDLVDHVAGQAMMMVLLTSAALAAAAFASLRRWDLVVLSCEQCGLRSVGARLVRAGHLEA
jgi:Na+-driven multidrug efflux pump